PCLVMLGREDRSFLLYYSLHTSLFQVLTDSIWMQGLVDNVGESFGHLYSIFCFLS
ncbi:hypothetical protein EDC04DRAFT_2580535, partial [Pisolithus marmoratus]